MKTFKSILALALALTLCLCLALPAFAADGDDSTSIDISTIAHISKDLYIAKGTTTPNATFTFTFEPDTENSIGLVGSESCPPIAAKSLTYTKSIEETGNDGKITLVTDNILDDQINFTHAGVYAYTVKETPNTYTAVNGVDEMTYDNTEYTLRIFVENVGDSIKIKGATIVSGGVKKPLTSDGTTDGENTKDVNVKTNGFRFANTYTKKAAGADGKALQITKTVTGAMGNKETQYFNYTLTVDKAPTVAENVTTYTYYVGNDTTAKTGTYGEEVTFQLKHGQSAYLKDVVAGATYSINEAGTAHYIPSAIVDNSSKDAKVGEALGFENVLIKEDGSLAAYTNERESTDVPDTGISINNLPFIMLISVSVMSLFVFFVSKKRRTDEA